MTKFKVGQAIEPIDFRLGYERAVVTAITESHYHLKIPCGKAIIPIWAEENYKLAKK